jgi:hypothetical protein
LPGIAGVILTIGMGVDSNVLIFERIREEVRAGKAPSAAVDQGFAHAWVTIVDTHVTTIVSAAILFMFGTGPVKGFAVTLTIGLAGQPVHGGLRLAGDLRCPPEQDEARRAGVDLDLGAKARDRGRQGKQRTLEPEGLQPPRKRREPVELFRGVNVDWLRLKWYFLAFSLIFSVAGIISMGMHWAQHRQPGAAWRGLPRRHAGAGAVFKQTPDINQDSPGHRGGRHQGREHSELR